MVKTKTEIHWLEIDGKKRPVWLPGEIIESIEKGEINFTDSSTGCSCALSRSDFVKMRSTCPYMKGDTIPGPDDCKGCDGSQGFLHRARNGPTMDFTEWEACPFCIDGKAPRKLAGVELVRLFDLGPEIGRPVVEALEWTNKYFVKTNPYLCLGDAIEVKEKLA